MGLVELSTAFKRGAEFSQATDNRQPTTANCLAIHDIDIEMSHQVQIQLLNGVHDRVIALRQCSGQDCPNRLAWRLVRNLSYLRVSKFLGFELQLGEVPEIPINIQQEQLFAILDHERIRRIQKHTRHRADDRIDRQYCALRIAKSPIVGNLIHRCFPELAFRSGRKARGDRALIEWPNTTTGRASFTTHPVAHAVQFVQ